MITTPVLTDEQQADITFDLLTSSGSRRYTSMATRAAMDAGLVGKLCSDDKHEFAAILALRAYELLGVIGSSKKRSVHEAEFATIVAALILANSSAGDALHALLSATTKSNLRWVAAMAHELVLNRIKSHSATETFSLHRPHDEDFDPCSFEAANDAYRCAA